MKKGFIEIPIIILVAISIGIGLWYYKSKPSDTVGTITEEEISTPTPTIEESPTPTLSPTTKPLPTKTPTPKPTASPTKTADDCSKFVPENGLATVTIKLKEKNGKALTGDWWVEVKHAGNCPGTVPGGTWEDVIRQGTWSWTSPGFQPQQLRVDVNYHGNGVGINVDAVSGNNVIEVEVEN